MHRVLKNSFITSFGHILNSLIGLLIISLLARMLPPQQLAAYAFAFVVVNIAFLITNSGINSLLIREIASDKAKAKQVLGIILFLKAALSILSPLILIIIVFAAGLSRAETFGILIASAWLIFRYFNSAYSALYQAFERMELDFLILLSTSALHLGLLFLLWRFSDGPRLIKIFAALVGAEGVVFLVVALLTHVRFIQPDFLVDRRIILQFVRSAVPIGVIALFFTLYFRVDILIFRIVGRQDQIAYYFTVYQMVQQLFFFATSTLKAIFPVLSRVFAQPEQAVSAIFERCFKLAVVIAAPISAAVFLLSERIILLLFGAAYLEAVIPLKLLAFVVFFTFPNALFVVLLIAARRERLLMKGFAFCLFINILFDFLLIPRFGAAGAAIATLCAETCLFGFQFYLITRNFIRIRLWESLIKPLSAAVILVVAIAYMKDFPWVYLVALSGGLYLLIVFLFRIFSEAERDFLLENLGVKKMWGGIGR